MAQTFKTVFPSTIYHSRLSPKLAKNLNRDLTQEIEALEQLDGQGVHWSKNHYSGGYSSYSSMDKLHETSPNFGELRELLKPHVKAYAKQLHWDLHGKRLEMTTCWANSMGFGTHHTMHTHPLCVISGVYYVTVPKGSSALKFEDPRLGFFMAAPPRKPNAPESVQNYISIPPVAGEFLLFESWMRHEVPPHRSKAPRLSISFNYECF